MKTSLTNTCPEFCQELTNQGQAFKFSIMLGTSFSFILVTRSKEHHLEDMKKKKPSPSSLRRNQIRRQDFLGTRKTITPEPKPTQKEAQHQCGLCGFEMNSERELGNHMRKKYKDRDQLCGSTLLSLLRSADGINERYSAFKTWGTEFESNVFLELHNERDHNKTENIVSSESLMDEWDLGCQEVTTELRRFL